MINKSLKLGLSILTLSTVILTGVIASNVQASTIENNSVEGNISTPILPDLSNVPPELLEDVKHPAFIGTRDGIFQKTDVSEQNFSDDEIGTPQKTTAKTQLIISEFGDTYIKVEESQ